MAELLLYERPVRLNRSAHATLRFEPVKDYSFCQHVAAVPLIAVKFPAACRQYPIVFVRAADGAISAQAVLSFRAGENAFVDEQGRCTAAYIPAFIRRYPFVLADIPGNRTDHDVAFDEASGCFSADQVEPLFSAQREPEPVLKSQVEFLRAFQGEHRRTQEFIQALEAADLLTPKNVDVVRADRERFGIRNALIVDGPKLLTLLPRMAKALLEFGYFGWMYAHLISLLYFTGPAESSRGVS